MPRFTEERWTGVGYDVIEESLPKADASGRGMLVGDDGEPVMEHVTTLVFILNQADGQRVVRIPFVDSALADLKAKLNGGIVTPPSPRIVLPQ